MTFYSGIKQKWDSIWRAAEIPENIQSAVETVQVERALTHVPMIYAVATLNIVLVIVLCIREELPVAQYSWMGIVLIGSLVRMIMWIRRGSSAAKIANPRKMLDVMTIVSVGVVAGLSGWTVYSLLSGSLMNLTLVPISLVFGSTCIAHCLAPIKRAAVSVLLVGVIPGAVTLIWIANSSGDFEAGLLGISMITIAFLMIRFIIACYNQIIAAILMEHQIRDMAHSDALTGLANRRAIMAELKQAEAVSCDGDGGYAVAMLDLDRFKQVNDSLGHHVGDGLLKAVAVRLLATAKPTEKVGRLGGDEFIVVMPGTRGEQQAAERVTAFLASFAVPAEVDGHRLSLSGSMGYAVHPRDGTTVAQVLKVADKALYVAKRGGQKQAHSSDDRKVA